MSAESGAGLTSDEKRQIRESLGWEWQAEPGVPSVDEALDETYEALEQIIAARASESGVAALANLAECAWRDDRGVQVVNLSAAQGLLRALADTHPTPPGKATP